MADLKGAVQGLPFFERGVENCCHDNEIHRNFVPSEIGHDAKGPQCSGHIPIDEDLV
jgi:hypothetical protein